MVAPIMESNIKIFDESGEEIQPAVTGQTNAYLVSGADNIDYEIRTYADNGQLASDFVEIELYEVKTNEAEDELIINTFSLIKYNISLILLNNSMWTMTD